MSNKEGKEMAIILIILNESLVVFSVVIQGWQDCSLGS